MEKKEEVSKKLNLTFLFNLILMVSGLAITYSAPYSNYVVYVTFGNLFFWLPLTFILTKSVVRKVFSYLSKNWNKKSLAIFSTYLSIHYFVYSIALERLLTSIYGELFRISSPFLTFSVSYFYPPGPYTFLINLIFNPSIVIGFPPNYYLELSFYSVIMGFLIDGVVTTTILRVLEIYKKVRIRAIIIPPILGVLAGGSCCVSIPVILATAIPAANVLFFLPIGNTALFLAYILLPPVTLIGLIFHFNSLFPKISRKFRLQR